MSLLRRKKWKKLYVSILAVIYLVFFTTQLSYKFHLRSNFPLAHSHARNSLQRSPLTSEPGGPNFNSKLLLSIDKRYELNHLPALITPEYRIDRWDLNDGKQTCTYCFPHTTPIPFYLTLRGPPNV